MNRRQLLPLLPFITLLGLSRVVYRVVTNLEIGGLDAEDAMLLAGDAPSSRQLLQQQQEPGGVETEWLTAEGESSASEGLLTTDMDFQTALLDYTMDLLPKGNEEDMSETRQELMPPPKEQDGETTTESHQKDVGPPYAYGQIDIMVPASGQDDRLRMFATRLGVAITKFTQWHAERLEELEQRRQAAEDGQADNGAVDDQAAAMLRNKNNKDGAPQDDQDVKRFHGPIKFRLLTTRYPQDKQTTEEELKAFQEELAQATTLPVDQIVIVRVGLDAPEEGEDEAENESQVELEEAEEEIEGQVPEEREKEEKERSPIVLGEKGETANKNAGKKLTGGVTKLDRNLQKFTASDIVNAKRKKTVYGDNKLIYNERWSRHHHTHFNRAHARNILHQNACATEDCAVASMDVDMQVLPIFFHNALTSVTPYQKAYFPIVFSEYNPWTVSLVQDFLYPPHKGGEDENKSDQNAAVPMLPPYSKHRGLWRDFGYGMYVLSGPDVHRHQFDETFTGWGGEDTDFYHLVHTQLRVERNREPGLIHVWHSKNCTPGYDVVTETQWRDCWNSHDVMEGSPLGMLLRAPLPDRSKQKYPGLPEREVPADAEQLHVEVSASTTLGPSGMSAAPGWHMAPKKSGNKLRGEGKEAAALNIEEKQKTVTKKGTRTKDKPIH